MKSKSIRFALWIMLAAILSFGTALPNVHGYSAPCESCRFRPAPAAATGIAYSQPHNLSSTLFPSSFAEYDTDQFVWDDFSLPLTQDIAAIEWRGGYDPALAPYAGPVTDFTVAIYRNSIANEPDVVNPPLVEYLAGGVAGETAAGTFGNIQMYDYTFTLPAFFHAVAGTKYWVQIEAIQSRTSNWGIAAGSGGNRAHFRQYHLDGGGTAYSRASGDAAFTLLGPVSNLVAGFDAAPTTGPVPLTTIFTNTSTGGYTASFWNFGDSITSTLPSPTHTFTAIGEFTVTLVIGDGSGVDMLTRSNLITVLPRPLATIEVAPHPVTVTVGATQAFTATGRDSCLSRAR